MFKQIVPEFGILDPISGFNFMIPIGISFYTLQVIGYCIDIYKGMYKAEKNIAKYSLFVIYFPHILQGPIARYNSISQTLYQGNSFNYKSVKYGFQLLLYGYFKKLVIADRAAIFVNHVYNNYQSFEGFHIMIASVLYSIQLYMDFSGCVDIALGISEMFGIKLGNNFNHPYFAVSIKDFWRRWHISLSSWFKDYIYIPLGGRYKGKLYQYRNIVIVFLISGIWHGVGLNYIIWGILHGLYQIIGELMIPVRNFLITHFRIKRDVFSNKLLKQFVTFLLVNFAWIFFRAPDITAALGIIKAMLLRFNPWVLFDHSLYTAGLDQRNFGLLVVCIVIVFAISILQEKIKIRVRLEEQNMVFRWGIYLLAMFSIIVLGIYGIGYDPAQFIYGNF